MEVERTTIPLSQLVGRQGFLLGLLGAMNYSWVARIFSQS